MSSASGVNILRYSALVLGVFYGLSHQSTIFSRERLAAANREYERKSDLISQAKAEWVRRQQRAEGSGGVITDPMNPQFDLEAFLKLQETK